MGKTRGGRQPRRARPKYHEIWFPTPEYCQKLDNLPTIQGKIFDNISELQQRDFLDPQKIEDDMKTF